MIRVFVVEDHTRKEGNLLEGLRIEAWTALLKEFQDAIKSDVIERPLKPDDLVGATATVIFAHRRRSAWPPAALIEFVDKQRKAGRMIEGWAYSASRKDLDEEMRGLPPEQPKTAIHLMCSLPNLMPLFGTGGANRRDSLRQRFKWLIEDPNRIHQPHPTMKHLTNEQL